MGRADFFVNRNVFTVRKALAATEPQGQSIHEARKVSAQFMDSTSISQEARDLAANFSASL